MPLRSVYGHAGASGMHHLCQPQKLVRWPDPPAHAQNTDAKACDIT
jgi:hypothetical protein